MILGIGIDLVASTRIQKLLNKFGPKFENKIFTDLEINRAHRIKEEGPFRAIFYAKRFAAKEAFSKAAGLGIGKNFGFKDIEINNNELGQPFITIPPKCENFLYSHFKVSKINIYLSITDEIFKENDNKGALAQAIVIISK